MAPAWDDKLLDDNLFVIFGGRVGHGGRAHESWAEGPVRILIPQILRRILKGYHVKLGG